MSEPQNTKQLKRQYWQDQVKAWQASHLSQTAYCAQSGIKLPTFSYWRSVLLEPENKKINKFASVKIIKDEVVKKPIQPIQIKLLSGHAVYLPIEMGLKEIIHLIHLLGLLPSYSCDVS